MKRQIGRPLRVVQVSFHADGERRDAASLLDAWPTIPSVARAVARTGVEVVVVQAAHRDEQFVRDEVAYHFLDDAARPSARVVSMVASLAPDIVHVRGIHHGRAVERLTRSVQSAPVLVQDHGALPPHRAAAARLALGASAPWRRGVHLHGTGERLVRRRRATADAADLSRPRRVQ